MKLIIRIERDKEIFKTDNAAVTDYLYSSDGLKNVRKVYFKVDK